MLSRIDNSASIRTPRFRTIVTGLTTLWSTLMFSSSADNFREFAAEPNQRITVLSAFNWSRFAAHQVQTVGTREWGNNRGLYKVGYRQDWARTKTCSQIRIASLSQIHNTSIVTDILNTLQWTSLEERRKRQRLVLCCIKSWPSGIMAKWQLTSQTIWTE